MWISPRKPRVSVARPMWFITLPEIVIGNYVISRLSGNKSYSLWRFRVAGTHPSRYKIASVTSEADASSLFCLYPRRLCSLLVLDSLSKEFGAPGRKIVYISVEILQRNMRFGGNYTYRVVYEVGASLRTFLPAASPSTFFRAFRIASEMCIVGRVVSSI